ncbi:MAG: helix-turn-helix domain-containing protein, partial [Bacteroidota bacterium]
MPKTHHVHLSPDERADLEALVARRSEKAEPVKRALMLLAADEANGAPALSDAEVADRYHVSIRTVERLRRRLVEHGLDLALHGVPRGPDQPPRNFDRQNQAPHRARPGSEPPRDPNAGTRQKHPHPLGA